MLIDFSLIQSHHPIEVYQCTCSRCFLIDDVINSDPFMLSVPPCEQYRDSYAVAPAPFDASLENTAVGRAAYINYTNIAVPAKYFNTSFLTVNGHTINALESKFRPIRRADNSPWGYVSHLVTSYLMKQLK